MVECGRQLEPGPVVANGQVFVASNKQLQIFGLLPASPNPQLSAAPATPAAARGAPARVRGLGNHCTRKHLSRVVSYPFRRFEECIELEI
jgi:hypothetical protein